MRLNWRHVVIIGLLAPGLALAAQAPTYTPPHLPAPSGFRVFIVPDMEGMGSAVDIHEVIAGNEGEQYRTLTSPDYWDHFRELLTREVNATIAGARLAGARSFVVNEGHGGNLFANVLPWQLDTAAILIRGFPKPLLMITGIDSTVGTLMFTGAHAGPGHPGILAHNFAFDSFTVNGKSLNEVGINALIAAEFGVAVSLVSGDDAEIAETRAILGSAFIGIITKYAVGRMAAITFSPARVRRMLADSAAVAVRRAMRGDFTPFRLEKPYRVELTLRRGYPEAIVQGVDSLNWRGLEKTGNRSYRLTTDDGRQIGYLLDAIERVVLH
ncbi:MAG TPA: M55 family metallopeptidase [Gemmatimonadales bacterium]